MVILLKIEMLIRQIREQKNMSIDELAKKSNVSKAHLSYIERNEKKATIDILVKIARALDIDITELYKVEW